MILSNEKIAEIYESARHEVWHNLHDYELHKDPEGVDARIFEVFCEALNEEAPVDSVYGQDSPDYYETDESRISAIMDLVDLRCGGLLRDEEEYNERLRIAE